MCCTEPAGFELPREIAEMLLRYRTERGNDPHGLWGDRANDWWKARIAACPFLSNARRFQMWERSWKEPGWLDSPELPVWIRDVVVAEDGRPAELSVVRVESDGHLTGEAADPRWILPGDEVVRRYVLIDSRHAESTRLEVNGQPVEVDADTAVLVDVDLSADRPDITVASGGHSIALSVLEPMRPARLRLRAGVCARWSIVDERGLAWFPTRAPHKWDHHGRPFFHGEDVEIEVPPVPLKLRVSRGLEYHSAERTITPTADEEQVVELAPERWMDPAANDWYGADFHVHMNYGSDHVIAPDDAALMQYGEGLHYMNLVAANESSSLIYDREALESWVGQDLPWSAENVLARMGVEYRNDLLGHVHASGMDAPPSQYHTGHAHSDADEDWPPNSVALEEFHEHGAITGYCHPVHNRLDDDSPPDVVFASVRTVECRELVVDAALGLVNGMDVVSNLDDEGAGVIFRRLLGAGIRLAATVGTDSMLSVANSRPYSNPPGWARMYAHVDGPLTMASLADAVRAGRTIATNGPWLELEVDGHGPGDRIDLAPGQPLRVRASAHGPGIDRLRIYTADGLLLSTANRDESNETTDRVSLEGTLTTTEPTYVVAVADGEEHPDVLDRRVFAHTSPVYVDVEGHAVARPEHAAWCLDWLTQLEKLIVEHGVFHADSHRDDLVRLIEQAREHYRSIVNA